ncbi:MAG: hypothetical protein K0S61_1052 [Anaerocolumna sp.]|jgi:hypothetical protein|nr:hypothetical protein [Anaerocolumna sp.]
MVNKNIVDTRLKQNSNCVIIVFNFLENHNYNQYIIDSVIERYRDITINFI